jgi:hypothetical protein
VNVHEKLLGAKIFLLAVTGVLAASQKKIECNGRHITAGFCCVRRDVQPDFDEMVGYGKWDGEFVLGRGSCRRNAAIRRWRRSPCLLPSLR